MLGDNDDAVTGSKKGIERDLTILRGTLVENVKESKTQPTLIYSTVMGSASF
jgi:hypothetical protein